MRMSAPFLLLAAALVCGGCDRARQPLMTTPPPGSIRLPAPDPDFRLTAEERAAVRPGFDVDALERLLAAIEPPFRPGILIRFQYGWQGMTIQVGDDPALVPLLDEVWAPFWEMRPERAFDDDETVRWPGRELARKRLEARGHKHDP